MERTTQRGDNDAELVAKSLSGSDKAFRTLVERYQPLVYSVVRGVLGDSDTAEDVVQEVFIKVFKGLHTYRGDAKLSTWMYRIARNEAVNAGRRTPPPTTPVEDVILEAPAGEGPDEAFRKKAIRENLDQSLARLEDNYRLVLELRYMGEMSYNEISDVMELPIGTVKTYIHRAKVELKRVMSREQFVEEHKRHHDM